MTPTILVALLIYLVIAILDAIMVKRVFKDLIDEGLINPHYAQAILCAMPIVNVITFVWFGIFYVHEVFRKN